MRRFAARIARRAAGLKVNAAMIRITDAISIDESELEESFVRSSGPGGQNVNKVSTAVQLRFDVRHSASLPNDVALRLMRLAGKRMTKDGVLVLIAQNHRTQERNRAEAQARLIDLLRQAAVRPVPRRATKPTKASKLRRIETKKHRSSVKAQRRGKPNWD
jgi:ribosome-associated protein